MTRVSPLQQPVPPKVFVIRVPSMWRCNTLNVLSQHRIEIKNTNFDLRMNSEAENNLPLVRVNISAQTRRKLKTGRLCWSMTNTVHISVIFPHSVSRGSIWNTVSKCRYTEERSRL